MCVDNSYSAMRILLKNMEDKLWNLWVDDNIKKLKIL